MGLVRGMKATAKNQTMRRIVLFAAGGPYYIHTISIWSAWYIAMAVGVHLGIS